MTHMPTRDEKRSLLTFYNALPKNSLTQCRIGEAAGALRTGFKLELGPEDRALVEMRYQGGKLTMRTFPVAFAMATKMYRDNPDTFVEAFSSEEHCRRYLARCRWPDGFRCPSCGGRNAYFCNQSELGKREDDN